MRPCAACASAPSAASRMLSARLPTTLVVNLTLLVLATDSSSGGASVSSIHQIRSLPPADWQRKIDAADALFSADDNDLPWRSQAGIGNGMLGGTLSGSRLNMAGVFSGNVRASVATELLSSRLGTGPTHEPLEPSGALLDLREATYTRRYSASGPCSGRRAQSGCTQGTDIYSAEQRLYAHRLVPSILVMEVAVTVPCRGDHNTLTLVMSHGHPINDTPHPPVPDTVKFINMSVLDGARISVGTTVHAEGGALPGKAGVLQVAMVATILPSVLEFSGCGNFSRRYLHVVRSSLNGSADVLSAAKADYATAIAATPGGLHRAHVLAWSELWRSGLEIGGRHETAVAINSSLYTVLSSLRSDWPYGCAPTGLYTSGWAGLAFCECNVTLTRVLLLRSSHAAPACSYATASHAGRIC